MSGYKDVGQYYLLKMYIQDSTESYISMIEKRPVTLPHDMKSDLKFGVLTTQCIKAPIYPF